MFERFTSGARRVVILAQEEAGMLSHNYIGTEHLLLGLSSESDGVAAEALESLEVSLDQVRQQVLEIIGRGKKPPSGHIPFTPRAKRVLELSLREALQLGHNYIGTEHLLLGLVREGEGVAAQILVRLGCDLNVVRHRVISLSPGQEAARFSTPARIVTRSEIASGLKEIADRLAAIEAHLGIIRRDGAAAAGPAEEPDPAGGAGTDPGAAGPGETSPPAAS